MRKKLIHYNDEECDEINKMFEKINQIRLANDESNLWVETFSGQWSIRDNDKKFKVVLSRRDDDLKSWVKGYLFSFQ